MRGNHGESEYQSVYRTRPLPVRKLVGTILVPEPIIDATRVALTDFALSGIRDGGHEGIVFWAGREFEGGMILTHAIHPRADHGPGHVHVSREEVGRVARIARSFKLGILCQIHTHPGADVRHSDGDDGLILLPFDGMLSIVVPHFGVRFHNFEDVGVHQFQGERWVLCSKNSVKDAISIFPSSTDAR